MSVPCSSACSRTVCMGRQRRVTSTSPEPPFWGSYAQSYQPSVQMNPEQIQAVRAWPQSETHKQLQQFLGFANFYRKFITSSRPLCKHSSGPLKPSRSSPNSRNCSPLPPSQLDPTRQFVVEVDVSGHKGRVFCPITQVLQWCHGSRLFRRCRCV